MNKIKPKNEYFANCGWNKINENNWNLTVNMQWNKQKQIETNICGFGSFSAMENDTFAIMGMLVLNMAIFDVRF